MESFLEALVILTKTTALVGLILAVVLLIGQIIIEFDNYVQTKYYKEKNKDYEFIQEIVLEDPEKKLVFNSIKTDLESKMLTEYYFMDYKNKHIRHLSKSDITLPLDIPLSTILKIELYFDKRKGWLFAYDMNQDGYHISLTVNFPNIYISGNKEYLVSSEELDIIRGRV